MAHPLILYARIFQFDRILLVKMLAKISAKKNYLSMCNTRVF